MGELALALGDAPPAKEVAGQPKRSPAQAKEDEAAQAKEAFVQAKEAFTRALQIDPTDPQAHGGLGRAYAALGDLPSAKAELEAALRQVDSDAVLQYEYGSLRRRLPCHQSTSAIPDTREARCLARRSSGWIAWLLSPA